MGATDRLGLAAATARRVPGSSRVSAAWRMGEVCAWERCACELRM